MSVFVLLASVTAVPAPSWSPYFCWAYDSFGNRLQQSQSTAAFTTGDGSCTFNGTDSQNVIASYNAQNQITSTNAPGYTLTPPTYDNAGDVTNDGKNVYLYDAEGRICAVYSDGGYTGYLYDAAGNRVAKGTLTSWSCDITTNGFTQTAGYVVGPSGEQLTEVDGSNNWVHTNVYAGGKQIGTYDGNVSSPTMHYYFDDPLGTRRAQTNAAGVLEAVYVSLPYGDGYAANTSDDPTENHFTGKERDAESGNDYFGARYYESSTGRFISPDWSASDDPVPYAKLGDPQSLNLYAYVGNNPITGIDPDGHTGCYVERMPVSSSSTCSDLQADLAEVLKGDSAADRLINAQNAAIKNKEFAPGYGGHTHCNQAVCSVAIAAGAPMGPLTNANGKALPANQIRANLAKPGSGYHEVPITEAQGLADRGAFVIAAGPGHVETVAPDTGQKLPGSGPIIAMVGYKNKDMRFSYTFTKSAMKEVKFYTPNQ